MLWTFMLRVIELHIKLWISNRPPRHSQFNHSLNPSHSIWVYVHREKRTYCLFFLKFTRREKKLKTKCCRIIMRKTELRLYSWGWLDDVVRYFCSYSIQRFSAHKTLHLLEGLGVRDLFSLTWHRDRRIIPPSILLGNETERIFFFIFPTIYLALKQKDACLSIFLSFFPSFPLFCLSFWKGSREERKKRRSRSQSYRVKHRGDEWQRKGNRGWEKTQRAPRFVFCHSLHHRLHQLPLSQREVTECVYMHCSD